MAPGEIHRYLGLGLRFTIYFISQRMISKTLDDFGMGQNVGALKMGMVTCIEPKTAQILRPVGVQSNLDPYQFILI